MSRCGASNRANTVPRCSTFLGYGRPCVDDLEEGHDYRPGSDHDSGGIFARRWSTVGAASKSAQRPEGLDSGHADVRTLS